MSAEGGSKAVIAALLANLGIAVTKFLAFLLTASSSMLAESIHSVADSGNQLLLLLGKKQARRGASPLHPFGHGRERYIYGFIVAVVLFTVGGLFALYEGWHKIQDPHGIESWKWVPVAVLVAALVMEGFSFRTAVHEANQVRGDTSWPGFIRRARSPELPVILLEDSAALVGLAFALVGVLLTLATGNGVWDGLGSIAIGLLLVCVAIVLAAEMKSLLVGESATREDVRRIEQALSAEPLVDRIIHMKTMHLGPDELLVAAKIAVTPTDSAAEVAHAIDAAEVRIRDAVPIARVIYLEPDLDRSLQRESEA
ncbi:cation diffusion facilitator family transporter [Actinopolymorpha cephalotaxi]|uniref:Cation diffusion facilitator family transporter n=1 Tax=Actinopolymorpha cephalotaxi TaxID=504797 RepID=A0A1I2KL84_9ACTN|nr:cation diffusion facilitator family transporter [Actinopolymorpha cephalotaxi]NYH84526.1 cation diffusion facilitator family transporter [Actinopolymorpha cephalotaxi]SFF67772.1 cation diffusion facilitator family transporter [Actinopolymorpha cephalotaxi]